MQGLADGYFVLPYTIQNYLADEIRTPRISTEQPAFDEAKKAIEDKIEKAVAAFANSKVAYFSCDGIPMYDLGTKSGRLRVQAHLSSSGLGVTCRILNDFIPDIAMLGIDPDTADVLRLAVQKRAGLCLVTGPTGSGKSTTLAAIIDWLRCNHAKHIVTVEDPIE